MEQVDDILAQSCQVTLSLALAVGLLDNSTEGFAVSNKPNTYPLKHEHLSLSNVNWAGCHLMLFPPHMVRFPLALFRTRPLEDC